MKLMNLLIIFEMLFSFANTDKKYVILGFDDYHGDESRTQFTITLKSYTNNYDILSEPFFFTSLINYSNGTNNSQIKW